MNFEDVIYVIILFFCMIFGVYYRNIKNAETKKVVGSIVGLLIVVMVSRCHTVHLLISTFINGCLILYGDKRNCHVHVFFFSFIYLFFFRTTIYFGIPYPPSHTNLVQMMLTLKIIGLAFETHQSYKLENNKLKNSSDQPDDIKNEADDIKNEEQIFEMDRYNFKLTFCDIFHYIFNYCGVLTGPYFRYTTYLDHLYKPYHKYANLKDAVAKRIYLLPFIASVYFILNYYWPLSYVSSPEFYERSFFYRYWYIFPTFSIFRMRIYFGLMLTELVCIMGGLGIYPVFTKPRSGNGPTQNFKQLEELTQPEDLAKTEYDYETVHCIDPYKSDFVPTMREAMKNWNITIQYWLANYVYKPFPYKKYRTNVTMLVSAIWHGVYAGYYFCIATVPFALLYENVWVKLLLGNDKEKSSKVANFVLWFLKMQMFSYQAIAFLLLDIGKIIKYYNSVYHCIPLLYVGLYFLGILLLQQKKIKEKTNKIKSG